MENHDRALDAVIAWCDPAEYEGRMRDVHTRTTAELRERVREAALSGEPLPALTVHDLRHTFATLALRRGVRVEVVSKVLGHAKPSITLDFYRHVLEAERREAVVDLFEPHASAAVVAARPAA